MADFQEKKRIRKILYSRITLIVLAVVLVLAASSVWAGYGKYREAKAHRDRVLERLGELQDREQVLKEELSRLGSSYGIEKELREKYNVAKEGEGVIIILQPQKNARTEHTEKTSKNFLANVLESIKNFFSEEK